MTPIFTAPETPSKTQKTTPTSPKHKMPETSQKPTMEQGTYEIIRDRLRKNGADLRKRLEQLNESRKAVFGSIETKLLATERISTDNNCLARDIISLGGNRFLFGYNVFMGLKTETQVADVFASFEYNPETHGFERIPSPFLKNENFLLDFKNLYKYYRDTRFVKFAEIGAHIFMVFQVGKTTDDIKTFKWLKGDGSANYLDNRSDHEYLFPPQHEFKWKKVNRDMQRQGAYPHISIEDRVFVETVGGDLTIKVEDNTKSGKGIYEEPVEEADQTLDDAEIYYALLGNLIALKIRPYKENDFRYFIFNEKISEVIRIDTLKDACVLLPDNQGLIFAEGYYIQTGEFKLFETALENMLFEKRILSPNGEDVLFVFYGKENGTYVLLSYNLIIQEVATPIICNGFSLFESGELIFFKAEAEQKKHHALQIWQTPYHSPNLVSERSSDAYLFKIGNKEVVQAMAEANELIKLVDKEDSYSGLYSELSKISRVILDNFHWLGHEEAFKLKEPIRAIRESAGSAIAEYDRVVEIRKNSNEALATVAAEAEKLIAKSGRGEAKDIDAYVARLSLLREVRGKMIALREMRYIDEIKVAEFEKELTEVSEKVSKNCADFLLKKEALEPYEKRVENLEAQVEKVQKVVEAAKLEEEIVRISKELEMLIDIVGNLNIEDATQTTAIIDNISGIYARFNSIKSALSKRRKALAVNEGESEFNAQFKLINQSLSNYLEIADSPDKCDQSLNKLLVQLEDLEAKFIDFDQFLSRISEKREEIYSAFESKKAALVNAQNKRSLALSDSANRIIEGIRKRLFAMASQEEINAYFAADIMVDKVRSLSKDLLAIGDSVKADTVQSNLKTAFEDANRQIKDKKELFVEGQEVIKLGKNRFNVNTLNADLSLVRRDDGFYYHITSTNFFEKAAPELFEPLKSVWDQPLISENNEVYRAEYLAFALYSESVLSKTDKEIKKPLELTEMSEKELLVYVQSKMATRFDEGYVKGVHDFDAAIILRQLAAFHTSAGLLRFAAKERVIGLLAWEIIAKSDQAAAWDSRMERAKAVCGIFPATDAFSALVAELAAIMEASLSAKTGIDANDFAQAARYIFELKTGKDAPTFSAGSNELTNQFKAFLKNQKALKEFEQSLKTLESEPEDRFFQAVNWMQSFVGQSGTSAEEGLLYEAAWLSMLPVVEKEKPHFHKLAAGLEGFKGDHPKVNSGVYNLHFNAFQKRLAHFRNVDAAAFHEFSDLRKSLLEAKKEDIRLQGFLPRVLSSFVRNQLLDEVYLPLIGENMAKQMGQAGESKRTDLMGLLLLISPPGYGKTTLMEYMANRLGLLFMKINGPSLGHDIKSLDPVVATNSAAREELEKLNLAFEMGDNVMIYIDDIQHCNPEFLQKFISLCDAQRKVDGVYNGRNKTYDFRGRKVMVVMAGNPYTESGERFQIPDMLANRADTYNLGDIIGGKAEAFALSYLENSLTSNAVVAPLNNKSRKDIYTLIRIAETGDMDGASFEAKHSQEEIEDYIGIFKMMIRVRDIVLKVNRAYIASASQADEYRTEPPFRLQGSYRNMNKLVEKLSPVMNDQELDSLILSHYENESQTLTKGAEFNFLRFQELYGSLTKDEKDRLEAIRAIFQKNQKMKGYGSNQNAVLMEGIGKISDGLEGIGKAIGGKSSQNKHD